MKAFTHILSIAIVGVVFSGASLFAQEIVDECTTPDELFTDNPPDWIDFPDTDTEIEDWLTPWDVPDGDGMDPDDWFSDLGTGLAEELGLVEDLEEWWEDSPDEVTSLGILLGVGILAADEMDWIDVEGELEDLGDIDIPEFTILETDLTDDTTLEFGIEGGEINFEEETANPVWSLELSTELEDGNTLDIEFFIETQIDAEDGIEFEDPFDDEIINVGVDVEVNF